MSLMRSVFRNGCRIYSSTSTVTLSNRCASTSNDQQNDEEWTEEQVKHYADVVRARGTTKVLHPYEPPSDLEAQIQSVVRSEINEPSKTDKDWKSISLNNPGLKFKLLNALRLRLDHAVPNSRLHEMRTVADLCDFYAEAVSNLTSYTQMSRDQQQQRMPPNLNVAEHAVRFHPDDKDAYHGGVTAFPATGGEVVSVRNQRLRRQFNPKKEWFDYENELFDHSKPPTDAPWDPDIVEKVDRLTFRLHKFK